MKRLGISISIALLGVFMLACSLGESLVLVEESQEERKVWYCPPLPSTFRESDLIGTWQARYLPGRITDTLILREDGTSRQIYESLSPGYHHYTYTSPWNQWYIEHSPSGGLYLHLVGMHYCEGGGDCARRGPGGGYGPYWDTCEKRRISDMGNEVILAVTGPLKGWGWPLESPPRGIILRHMRLGDAGISFFILLEGWEKRWTEVAYEEVDCGGGDVVNRDDRRMCGMLATDADSVSLGRLIAMVEAANPDLPGWDRVDFWFAVEELGRLGPAAAPAAPALARALQYRRRDSYVVTKALVAMGPAAALAIPELVKALGNERAIVRSDAAFVLGTIGEPARCAVPAVAPLLWDSDPWVRSAAAGALEAITGVDLVAEFHELNSETPGSVGGDEPEGKITGKARSWWITEGQYLDWSGEPNLCNANGL